jgi:hypothetical protein
MPVPSFVIFLNFIKKVFNKMENFLEIVKFLNIPNFEDKYNAEKLYQMYNIIKNKDEDNITLYNKIMLLLKNVNNENFIFREKDKIFQKKLWNIIELIKLLESNEADLNNLNKEIINIYVNYYIYKNIDKETFEIILEYRKKLKYEEPKILYQELWYKFISPLSEKALEINFDYYIEYQETENIEKLKNINSEIISKYINKLTENKITKLKYSYIPNIETLFFILFL